jgi:EAL domain-containing protein (putative c-di-GMP-specific phosphodiesterase class I)
LEALLRWQHPRLGQILPGDFLHLATSPELQSAITQWVIRAALDQVTNWNEEGERLGVSVNLSHHDITHIEKTVSAVRGTRTGAVTFELRPGDLGSDDLRLAAVRLSAVGAEVALDDVGLQDAPSRALAGTIDEVKISRALVTRAVADSRAGADLRALVELARDLRLNVVAVGVEDKRTYELVAALGCDMAQGYWVSRPLVPDRMRSARRWAAGLAFTGAVAFASQTGAAKAAASGDRAISLPLTTDGLFSSACCLDLPAPGDQAASTASAKLEQLRNRTGLPFSTKAVAGADIFFESTTDTSIQQSMATTVERDIAELEQEFGRKLVERPSIYFFSTRTSFAMGLQQVFGVRAPDAGVLAAANGGIALPKQGAIAINLQNVNVQDLVVVRHELTHALVNEIIGPDGELPTWLHEGIATLEERGPGVDEIAGAWSRASALAVLSTGATTLSELEPANQWLQRNAMLQGKAYTVSAEAVRLLEQRVSREGLLRILGSVGHGESFGLAFIAEAGESPGDFARAFPARLAAEGSPQILQAQDARGVRWSLAGFTPSSPVSISIEGQGYSVRFEVTTDENGMYQAVFGETAPKGEYALGASSPSANARTVMRT